MAELTWPDLVRDMESNNNVYRVTMEKLRLLEGAQRIGPNVISAIDDRLKVLGIGHLPVTLPNRGDDSVLLYRQGTTASEVIRAIADGLHGSVGQVTVEALQRLNEPPPKESVVSTNVVLDKTTKAAAILADLLSTVRTEGKTA